MVKTRDQQLLLHVRTVNRLVNERKRLQKRIKAIAHDLKLTRACIRAIMRQVGEGDPAVAPMRLFAGATGIRAELGKRDKSAIKSAPLVD